MLNLVLGDDTGSFNSLTSSHVGRSFIEEKGISVLTRVELAVLTYITGR